MKVFVIKTLFYTQLIFPLAFIFIEITHAQSLYTNPVFSIRKDSAVYVGTAPNYCGLGYDIKVNIYKPIGDFNTKRPVAICIHGGAFTSSEDFNEPLTNGLAQEFAKRGYVGVCIDYREGHHLYNYGTAYPQPTSALTLAADWTTTARLYISDSAEAIRSVYRAQQDIKGIIRFIKANQLADSSCPGNIFLVGHSAGAIAALAAGFTDLPSKKPIEAAAASAVINPAWKSDGFDFFGSWIVTQINGPQDKDNAAYRQHNPLPFNFEAPNCYVRPDLGDINGSTVSSNGYDANILGVASLCGALIDSNLFTGSSKPAVYMYHQPADRVVSFNSAKPFGYLADGFYPSPNEKWPVMYGNGWIKEKLNRINYAAPYKLWTYDNSANDPLGLSTHDLLPSYGVVADSIARFFSSVIFNNRCPIVLPIAPQFFGSEVNGVAKLSVLFSSPPEPNSRFFIEKSINGREFYFLGAIRFYGNNLHYLLEDAFTESKIFYRLTTLQQDGSISHSSIINFGKEKSKKLMVYPNPVFNQPVKLAYNNEKNPTTALLQVINQTGQIITTKKIMLQRGVNQFQCELGKLPVGFYIVNLLFEDKRANEYASLVNAAN